MPTEAAILILSDRGVNEELVPIPALLATSGVHHHLVREESRTRCGLVIETGEAREVHHFALLTGYGAGAVNPYLAFATLGELLAAGFISDKYTYDKLEKNYIKAIGKGLLKVASKMGISTQQSYRGAQIFEAVGLASEFVDEYFTWTPSRIEGVGLEAVADEALARHEYAWPRTAGRRDRSISTSVGNISGVARAKRHIFSPEVIAKLQYSTRINSREEFRKFCQLIDDQQRQLLTLRGLLDFQFERPADSAGRSRAGRRDRQAFCHRRHVVRLDLARKAHETLAIAMNRIGGRSNTGEGGEDSARYKPDANGDNRSSAIKQVASGRFGVTSEYLCSARELQIKMAQGAKPGEGGQLPGHKVDKEIARIRHSTAGVGLISPPPHHDIYSIEDLSQLIHDLKNANRQPASASSSWPRSASEPSPRAWPKARPTWC